MAIIKIVDQRVAGHSEYISDLGWQWYSFKPDVSSTTNLYPAFESPNDFGLAARLATGMDKRFSLLAEELPASLTFAATPTASHLHFLSDFLVEDAQQIGLQSFSTYVKPDEASIGYFYSSSRDRHFRVDYEPVIETITTTERVNVGSSRRPVWQDRVVEKQEQTGLVVYSIEEAFRKGGDTVYASRWISEDGMVLSNNRSEWSGTFDSLQELTLDIDWNAPPATVWSAPENSKATFTEWSYALDVGMAKDSSGLWQGTKNDESLTLITRTGETVTVRSPFSEDSQWLQRYSQAWAFGYEVPTSPQKWESFDYLTKADHLTPLWSRDYDFSTESINASDAIVWDQWYLVGDDLVLFEPGPSTSREGLAEIDHRAWRDMPLLFSGNGNDTIVGSSGREILDGGLGQDVLNGVAGPDLFYVTSGDVVITSGVTPWASEGESLPLNDFTPDRFYNTSFADMTILVFDAAGTDSSRYVLNEGAAVDLLVAAGVMSGHYSHAETNFPGFYSMAFAASPSVAVDPLVNLDVQRDVFVINDHGFNTGDILQYTAQNDGKFETIGSLSSGDYYLVDKVSDSEFRLLSGSLGPDGPVAGMPVSLTVPEWGRHTLTLQHLVTDQNGDVYPTDYRYVGDLDLAKELWAEWSSPRYLQDELEIVGNEFSQILVGNEGENTLRGEAGDDELFGLHGDDVLDGGDGNDVLASGAGDDTVFGGAGDDVLLMNFGTGDTQSISGLPVDLSITGGSDYFNGGSGLDKISVAIRYLTDPTTGELITNAANEFVALERVVNDGLVIKTELTEAGQVYRDFLQSLYGEEYLVGVWPTNESIQISQVESVYTVPITLEFEPSQPDPNQPSPDAIPWLVQSSSATEAFAAYPDQFQWLNYHTQEWSGPEQQHFMEQYLGFDQLTADGFLTLEPVSKLPELAKFEFQDDVFAVGKQIWYTDSYSYVNNVPLTQSWDLIDLAQLTDQFSLWDGVFAFELDTVPVDLLPYLESYFETSDPEARYIIISDFVNNEAGAFQGYHAFHITQVAANGAAPTPQGFDFVLEAQGDDVPTWSLWVSPNPGAPIPAVVDPLPFKSFEVFHWGGAGGYYSTTSLVRAGSDVHLRADLTPVLSRSIDLRDEVGTQTGTPSVQFSSEQIFFRTGGIGDFLFFGEDATVQENAVVIEYRPSSNQAYAGMPWASFVPSAWATYGGVEVPVQIAWESGEVIAKEHVISQVTTTSDGQGLRFVIPESQLGLGFRSGSDPALLPSELIDINSGEPVQLTSLDFGIELRNLPYSTHDYWFDFVDDEGIEYSLELSNALAWLPSGEAFIASWWQENAPADVVEALQISQVVDATFRKVQGDGPDFSPFNDGQRYKLLLNEEGDLAVADLSSALSGVSLSLFKQFIGGEASMGFDLDISEFSIPMQEYSRWHLPPIAILDANGSHPLDVDYIVHSEAGADGQYGQRLAVVLDLSPLSIDFDANQIYLPNHGLISGDTIYFSASMLPMVASEFAQPGVARKMFEVRVNSSDYLQLVDVSTQNGPVLDLVSQNIEVEIGSVADFQSHSWLSSMGGSSAYQFDIDLTFDAGRLDREGVLDRLRLNSSQEVPEKGPLDLNTRGWDVAISPSLVLSFNGDQQAHDAFVSNLRSLPVDTSGFSSFDSERQGLTGQYTNVEIHFQHLAGRAENGSIGGVEYWNDFYIYGVDPAAFQSLVTLGVIGTDGLVNAAYQDSLSMSGGPAAFVNLAERDPQGGYSVTAILKDPQFYSDSYDLASHISVYELVQANESPYDLFVNFSSLESKFLVVDQESTPRVGATFPTPKHTTLLDLMGVDSSSYKGLDLVAGLSLVDSDVLAPSPDVMTFDFYSGTSSGDVIRIDEMVFKGETSEGGVSEGGNVDYGISLGTDGVEDKGPYGEPNFITVAAEELVRVETAREKAGAGALEPWYLDGDTGNDLYEINLITGLAGDGKDYSGVRIELSDAGGIDTLNVLVNNQAILPTWSNDLAKLEVRAFDSASSFLPGESISLATGLEVFGESSVWSNSGDTAGTRFSLGQDLSGSNLTFSVTGTTNFNSPSYDAGPDGYPESPAFVTVDLTSGEILPAGYANVIAPFSSLLGVFVDSDGPNQVAPESLNFSQIGLNFQQLSPSLYQPFFIGDGFDDVNAKQEFVVPDGATELIFGTMDEHGWIDNWGALSVDISIANALAGQTLSIESGAIEKLLLDSASIAQVDEDGLDTTFGTGREYWIGSVQEDDETDAVIGVGGAGDDVLLQVAGREVHQFGGAGDDLIYVNASQGSSASGGEGFNTLVLMPTTVASSSPSTDGDSAIHVPTQSAWLSYEDAKEGAYAEVYLAAGIGILYETDASGEDQLLGVDMLESQVLGQGWANVVGTSGDDLLNGDKGANQLVGGAGDDRLYGGLTLIEDASVGEVIDVLSGGQGNDRFIVSSNSKAMTVIEEASDLSGGTDDRVLIDLSASKIDQLVSSWEGGTVLGIKAVGNTDNADTEDDQVVTNLFKVENRFSVERIGFSEDLFSASEPQVEYHRLAYGAGSSQSEIILTGKSGNAFFVGGGGQDIMLDASFDDIYVGGSSTDLMYALMGRDRVIAGGGDDDIYVGLGTKNRDIVLTGQGKDTVHVQLNDTVAISYDPQMAIRDDMVSKVFDFKTDSDVINIHLQGSRAIDEQADAVWIQTGEFIEQGRWVFSEQAFDGVLEGVTKTKFYSESSYDLAVEDFIDFTFTDGTVETAVVNDLNLDAVDVMGYSPGHGFMSLRFEDGEVLDLNLDVSAVMVQADTSTGIISLDGQAVVQITSMIGVADPTAFLNQVHIEGFTQDTTLTQFVNQWEQWG